ncbi:MAG: hypothetical protein WD939_02265, partial [Dehalococcoidia bacterium]
LRWDGAVPASAPLGAAVAEPDALEGARRIKEDGAFTGITVEEVRGVAEYARKAGRGDDFEIVIEGNSSGTRRRQAAARVAEYAAAGATWWFEGVFSWLYLPPHDIERMRARIRQGPPRM